MELKILNNSSFENPYYATEGSAGLDLKANIDAPIIISPLERVLIKTGLILEIPEGCVGMVCPRSGLAIKQGITVLNSPGIVDADFRQEVQVILINLSNDEVIIEPGDRIAQMVFTSFEKMIIKTLQSSEELSSSNRIGGFGSTGIK